MGTKLRPIDDLLQYYLQSAKRHEQNLGEALLELSTGLFRVEGLLGSNVVGTTGFLDAGKIDPFTLRPELAIVLKELGIAAQGVSTQLLKDLAVTAAKIVTAGVDTTKLADAAVTTAKLAGLAVDNTKLANLAVDAAKLADSAVTSTKIANAAVGSAAIANLAVGTAHIADLAVTSAQIGDAAIVSAKIANAAVGAAAIAALVVGEAHIQNAAIVNAKIGNLEVDNIKIANVSIAKLIAGTATFTGDVNFSNTGNVNLFNGGNIFITPGTVFGTRGEFKSAGIGWLIVPGAAAEILPTGVVGKVSAEINGETHGVRMRHFSQAARPTLKSGETAFWFRSTDGFAGLLHFDATNYWWWRSADGTNTVTEANP